MTTTRCAHRPLNKGGDSVRGDFASFLVEICEVVHHVPAEVTCSYWGFSGRTRNMEWLEAQIRQHTAEDELSRQEADR